MKMVKVGFVAVALVLNFGQANAQSGITRTSTSPIEKQFEVLLTDNTLIVADDGTSRIYIAGSDGQHVEVTFAEAIAAAEPDPAKRPQLLSMLRSSLNDPHHMVSIVAPRIATDTSIWPYEYCGEFACISPYKSPKKGKRGGDHLLREYEVSGGECTHYLCPKMPWPCDAGPCSPKRWGSGHYFYSGTFAGWGDEEGGGNLPEQGLLTEDKERWGEEEGGVCKEAAVAAAGTAALGSIVVGSCIGGAATGAGTAVCAGGIVLYLIEVHKLNKKIDKCYANYPGPGKW